MGHQPRITDFGLAKRVAADSDLTRSGQILGSPSYMPPEQASGEHGEVGPASDVYALGAVLYDLLTGRPPFKAETPTDTLLQVLQGEPASLRSLNPKVPRDLETICLKCLQKEPQRRYATAGELAAELRRFLRGEPIHASPITRSERAWRWCRRNPVVSSLGAGLLVVLLAGLAGVTSQWIRAEQESQIARQREREARDQRDAADEARRLADELREQAAARADELARKNYLIHLANADNALLDYDYSRARIELDACAEQPRGWEHEFLNERTRMTISAEFPGAQEPILTRDGKLIAIGFAGSPDEHKVLVWDLASGRCVGELLHTSRLASTTMSKDGRWLAGGDFVGGVVVWDRQTGEKKWYLKELTDRFDGMAFSPDGSLLATANWDGTLTVFDVSSGTVKSSLAFGARGLRKVMFSPDGRWIVVGFNMGGHPAAVVDASTGKTATRFPQGGYSIPTFSPDGRWIATGKRDGTITLWNWDGRELSEERSWKPGNDWYWDLVFGDDATRLVTSSLTHKIQVWNVRTGEELASFDAGANAYWLTMSPLRDEVAVFTSVHGIRLWQYAGKREGLTARPFDGIPPTLVSFSPDSRTICVASDADGADSLTMLDAGSGERTGTLDVPCRTFSWMPDGQHVVVCSEPQQEIQMRHALTEALIRTFPGKADWGQLYVDLTGRVLTSVGADGIIRTWDLLSAEPRGEFLTRPHRPLCADVGKYGRLVAVAFYEEHKVEVWDSRTTRLVQTLPTPGRWPSCLKFSRDGKHLYVGSDGGQLTRHDVDSGKETGRFGGHKLEVRAVAISPRERQVISSDRAGRTVIWDVESTQPLLTLLRESGTYVNSLDWSSDNRYIAAGKSDGTVQIWKLPTAP